jgi:hypothetical protein
MKKYMITNWPSIVDVTMIWRVDYDYTKDNGSYDIIVYNMKWEIVLDTSYSEQEGAEMFMEELREKMEKAWCEF